MNFDPRHSWPITGTHFVGTMQAQRRHLTEVFGPPIVDGDERQGVWFEWRMRFGDGMIATVYCWREPNPPAADEVITWRIGGQSVYAMHRVHEAFRSARQEQ